MRTTFFAMEEVLRATNSEDKKNGVNQVWH